MYSYIESDFDNEKTKAEFGAAFKKGLRVLKSEIVKDTSPLTPFDTGILNKSVIPSSRKLDEWLVWNTPYAHFINEGVVMVDRLTGSAYARRFSSKVSTGRSLVYHNPDSNRRDHFYERAKAKHKLDWEAAFRKGAKRDG